MAWRMDTSVTCLALGYKLALRPSVRLEPLGSVWTGSGMIMMMMIFP